VSFVALLASPVRAKDGYAEVSAVLNTTALQTGQQAVIAIVTEIKDGYHAQSHTPSSQDYIPFEVKLDANPAFTAYDPIYPKGEDHEYRLLGKLNVYTGKVITYIPIDLKGDAPLGEIKITGTVTYQACDDKACFAPQSPQLTIETKIVAAGVATTLNQPELFKGFDPKAVKRTPTTAPASKPSTAWTIFGHEIGGSSYAIAFAAALLIGIIFNVMPCVLPVLPLKAVGFYETSQHHRGKSFLYGVVFSLGIVATFSVLALLVLPVTAGSGGGGGGGTNWGQWFSKPWFVWPVVVILVAMGLGMFGLFTFRLPMGVYSIEPKHDSYVGNFLFGILTAILSTPCTAPLFPGLLAWAAAQSASGGRFVGVGVVVMVGVGMALPYLLLSALPELARKLPRTGPWSELVKQLMAFLLFGVAAYFAGQRLLAGNGFLWVVFAIAVAAGIFLLVRTVQLMPRAVPIAISLLIALGLAGGAFALARALNRQTLSWTPYAPAALEQARSANRIVLLEFTAKWCANCQYVEGTVFHDEQIEQKLMKNQVVLLRADLTDSSAPGWDLLRQLNPSGGIPLTAIYAPNQVDPTLLASIYTKQTLAETLDRVMGPQVK
jgi:thiol:disulfide interchange protein DsbD